MRSVIMAMWGCAVALPLQAAVLTCDFDSECLEGEACAATTYGFEIENTAPGEDVGVALPTIKDETGDYPVPFRLEKRDGDRIWAGLSTLGSHLLTVAPDGTARYSLHFEDATFSALYTGTCSETN